MKKLVVFLLLLGITSSVQNASAQMRCDTRITFKDSDGYYYSPTPLVIITHTDSATHSTNPIQNFMGKVEGAYGYQDSFTLDTSDHDTAFTVNYFVCGQWYKIDTCYTKEYPNSRERELDITINVPCKRPCYAGFHISDYRLRYWGEYDFNAGQVGGSTQHEWHLGNGKIRYTENTSESYDTVGTVYIKHIMRDTVRGCVDSSIQSINISAECQGSFSYNDLNYGKYKLTAVKSNAAYSNYWYIDGVLVDSGGIIEHQFLSSGYHSIKLINSYQNECADSSEKVINVNNISCSISITYSKSNRQVTFTPALSNIAYHYDFGDGDTGTYIGQFTHTYPLKTAYYKVNVSEAYRICSIRTLSFTIQLACNGNFTINNTAKFTFSVSNSPTSNLTSRYRLSNGDSLIGNSGSFQVNTAGTYTLIHDFYDQTGLTQCEVTKSIYVNNCGLVSHSPINLYAMGQVELNGQIKNDYDSLKVYLIKHNASAGTLTAIDSITIHSSTNDTAFYEFTLQCDSSSSYLVKAALMPGSRHYANYLPTYYPSNSTWSSAQPLSQPGYYLIDMISGTNPGGPGFIGGLISQGANKKFKPLSGIQVNLFNDQSNPVAYTYSDANGAYSFDNIAYGKYQVIVEELGKTSASYWITLDANNPKVEERNFEVNSSYVSILSTGLNQQKASVSRVYPNPSDKVLFIEWTDNADENVCLEFYTIDGKLMKSIPVERMGQTQSEIAIDVLPSGVYILRIQGDSSISTLRIQKN